ncbi:MAG TPA: serine/threonine-protein kinase [Gemmatimonadaceae bacterium]|nr:serine/threonine-protein kinase [Gemmatimonadaceae bacterium]
MNLSVTCSVCASAVPAGDRFCGTCGNPITGSALISGEGARFDPWTELLQKLRSATLGEYEIKGELGRGGMAAVFLAHDLQLNRRVAIKVMLPGLAYGERMWDRFLAEARTAAKLDHPHIVYIHSVKEKDRFLYFVMKHIDGRSLDDLLSQHKPFPVPVAQTILAEVARGLDYAHREGVIHRDIKPANIMVDQKGQSIVMDFGIARAAETEHFTQTGATIGTPAYMSPEQCHGAETSAASDQYSLGILAYELLTGAPPFSGTPIELQIAHMQDTPIPIRDRRSDLSLELSGAVMRMLLKKPEERWSSLRELVPIFSRGLEALGEEPRDELIAMVKSGGPRRKSFPATPLSPLPAGMPKPPVTPYPARASSDTMAVDYTSGDLVAQHSAEREAPTEISGPMFAVSSPASEVMWKAANSPELDLDGFGAPAAGAVEIAGARGPRRMPARTAMIVSSGVVLAVIGTLALRGEKKTATPAAPAPAPVNTIAVSSPSPGVAPTVQRLPGDSTAVGVAPAAKAGAGAKGPREVSVDAVALLQLALSKPRAAPGDTIHARLDALDDAGKPVTTSQIVWTSSDPTVVRFAGPGQLIAVKAGKATITVTAGTTTTGRELTVVAKKH